MLDAIKKLFYRTTRWARKQRLAKPGRYYGDGGTIHNTTAVDVEVYEGKVVAVWFRCQPLAFKAADVDERRARDMTGIEGSELSGVEVASD